jgi:glycosyltransferase involved in cell wall biosynthesis
LARPYQQYSRFSRKDDLIFYHLSDPSPMTVFFHNLPGRKIIIYHNVTPHHFFRESRLFYPTQDPQEIQALAEVVEFAFGVSEFNRAELAGFGFKNTGVLPMIFNPGNYCLAENPEIIKKFRDGGTNLLFVGRIAPNKKIEDLLEIFYFYKTYVNPASRLILVGGIFKLFEPYYGRLCRLVEELGLEGVFFAGGVSQRDLVSFYRVADVYLSASEHEGFGVPLLEAMYFGLPVVAYRAAAVPETLGGAGIMYQEKNPALVAELIERVVGEVNWRAALVARQYLRVQDFYPERITAILRPWLKKINPPIII